MVPVEGSSPGDEESSGILDPWWNAAKERPRMVVSPTERSHVPSIISPGEIIEANCSDTVPTNFVHLSAIKKAKMDLTDMALS